MGFPFRAFDSCSEESPPATIAIVRFISFVFGGLVAVYLFFVRVL